MKRSSAFSLVSLRFERFDLNVRIQIGQTRSRGGRSSGLPTSLGAEGDLALQIGEVHDIEIHQAKVPDASRGQIQPERRAESAGADQQHLGVFELELTFHADFRHDQMPAVAQNFFVGQRGAALLRCLTSVLSSP